MTPDPIKIVHQCTKAHLSTTLFLLQIREIFIQPKHRNFSSEPSYYENVIYYREFVVWNRSAPLTRGRHWDPSPNPKVLGLGSIFQNFGIGIGFGIDFSEFWDWDRFSKSLGSGLGLQIQDKNPRNPNNPKKSQRSLLKFKIILYPWIINNFFRIIVFDWKCLLKPSRSREILFLRLFFFWNFNRSSHL